MKTRTRLLSGLGAILVASSGVIAGAALPATAAPAHHVNTSTEGSRYVALGDSFAAGQGAGHYLNTCYQSRKGYPALLDTVVGIDLVSNATCSGYTTTNVQQHLPSSLNWSTKLVTVTVGANDVKVADVATACTLDPDPLVGPCATALVTAKGLLGSLGPSLASTYASIAAAAPHARILVTGYPYLFDTSISGPAGLYSVINAATDGLNGTISGAVTTVQKAGANIDYVDVTKAFNPCGIDHGIGSPDPWINDPTIDPIATDAFHPNADGYVAYEHAVLAELRPANVKKAPCRNR